MSLKLNSSSGGSVTLTQPVTAADYTQTLVAATDNLAPIILGTAQNTTSGTSIDFTGIPSWVKRITVMLNGVSTSGTSNIIIRVGTSGGYVSSGYSGSGTSSGATNAVSSTSYTTGFGFAGTIAATTVCVIVGTIINQSGTTWSFCASGAFIGSPAFTGTGGGYVDAGGTLNSLRITTVNGTDTFDAGSVNIMYE